MPGAHTNAGRDTSSIRSIKFHGILKGKSSLMIYEEDPALKYKYRNREFRCREYYVDTAEKMQRKMRNTYDTSWKKIRQETS